MSDIEQRIRDRAYQLWEQAGRPQEHSDDYWFRARQEIEGDVLPTGDRPAGAMDDGGDDDASGNQPDTPAHVSGLAGAATQEVPDDESNRVTPPVGDTPAPATPAGASLRTSRAVATNESRLAADAGSDATSEPQAGQRRPRGGSRG